MINKFNPHRVAILLSALWSIGPAMAVPSPVTTPFQVNANTGRFEVMIPEKGWQSIFIKGVNIGVGKPGRFPGELAITKAEYSRWLGMIGKMNANTIRVYTLQTPAFYEALYQYNRSHRGKPLYLVHGVWINEDDIAALQDPFASNQKIRTDFIADTQTLIDVVHGNKTVAPSPGHASGVYTRDISDYVIAWVLGIEWAPSMVAKTNATHVSDQAAYDGQYIQTETGAAPFEVFLAQVADAAIAYETDHYAEQRPLSFTNWPTTDMLSHPNEPFRDEDLVTVNLEYLKAKSGYLAGLFAAYHIYPYYPDFMNYQAEYQTFTDDNGHLDSYKGYLHDLRSHHTLPVLVAEFGVPASRGMTHRNLPMGFNQGFHSEQEQGQMDVKMLADIQDENYAGGLLFAWQDEWFKRTWNTMDFDLPSQRPYWSNAQTNEQEFGLLAFDPGKKDIYRIDGQFGDWRGSKPIYQGNGVKLHAKSDEKYVYLMAEVPGFDFDHDTLVIPVDVIPQQGSSLLTDYNMTFSQGADFLVTLNGQNNARISVEAYYDAFYYLYSTMTDHIPKDDTFEVSGQGLFVPMRLCLNKELFLPQDGRTIPFDFYETGKLKFGDGNPAHTNFDSLTDFAYGKNRFEIRIPWQLLNVMDPSTKQIMANFHTTTSADPLVSYPAQPSNGFYFGAAIYKPGNSPQAVSAGKFDWQPWNLPKYHERLKRSYYVLKDYFKSL